MTLNPPAPKPTTAATIRKEVSRRAEVLFVLAVFILGLVIGRFL